MKLVRLNNLQQVFRIFGISIFLLGCSTNQCRGDLKVAENTTPIQNLKTVKVAKSDGSLQCQGKGIAVEVMQKELEGIKVLSSVQLNDGKMRIQKCGSQTGNFNVYEIEERDLAAALKLGFKEWKTE